MPKEDIDISFYDLTPFTILDYPDHTACIIWTAGCNMRCPYCHNPEIVLKSRTQQVAPSLDDIFAFLKKRKNLLDAVVISGGECTLYNDLPLFCSKIKEMGFKIKIDSNASRFEIIKELSDKDLINYFAIDFKAPKNKYHQITKNNSYENLIKSINYLIKNQKNFEIRTTVHTDLLDEKDIEEIASLLKDLNYKGIYYIQNFQYRDKTLEDIKEQKRPLDIESLRLETEVEFRNF